jgi:hypothetical protein
MVRRLIIEHFTRRTRRSGISPIHDAVNCSAGHRFVSGRVWLKPSYALQSARGGRPRGPNFVLLTKQGTVTANLIFSRRAA